MNSRNEPVVVVGSGPLGAVAARRLAARLAGRGGDGQEPARARGRREPGP